ncbi:MAG: hypothetical protein DI630_00530 [Gordonia sp. (in: high G+C Gram-positive bacteria)]|nr:MAG: hypothetical protein DI630_00530 [Gordonia sp. (in: high G+C Gram-positive bacteria)]
MDAEIAGGRANRRARRAAGQRGAHRAPSQPGRTTMGLVGVGTALAVVAGAAGVAGADPVFNPLPPSASNPTPGTSNPTPPPTADVGPGAIIDPPSESGWRPNPWANNAPTSYVPVQNWAPQPTFIGPVALPPPPPMIMPEPGMIRIGKYQEVKPPWITMAEMNSINRWSAYLESRIAQFWLSQGLSLEEADQRAATSVVGGIGGAAVGGAIGFVVGVAPGALVGAGLGAAGGAGVAAALGLPLNALFPVAGTGLYGSFIGVGALAGAGAGAVAGGLAGGLALAIPAAALGAGLGSLFGGGDPNAEINQPWNYRDGQGVITPKANALEFDWNAIDSNMLPEGWVLPEEAHLNFQVKEDNTYVLKLGEERWFGATEQQRDHYFYGEMDKTLPGAGGVVKDFFENENGPFQNEVRGLFQRITAGDPRTAQYNPNGDIADPSARAERVPYPTTSTPDPWDEPNREGVNEQNEANQVGEPLPGLGIAPTTVQAPVQAPAPVQAAPAVTETKSVVPEPVQQAVDAAPAPIRQAVNDAQGALGDLIPGLLGA